MKNNAPDVSGRTRNKDKGLPNSSRFATEEKRDGDPLAVDHSTPPEIEQTADNSTLFAAGQPVVFRESGGGPAEPGTVAEVYEASDEYPNGGLFRVALADGGTVEAWCKELTSDDSARFVPGQSVSVRLPGVGEMTGGIIAYAFDPDKEFPNGGMFEVAFPHGLEVEAMWTDITAVEPEPDEHRYATGGGVFMEPTVYHLERDGELITTVKSGDSEYRVTGELGSTDFRVESPFTDDIYASAARAYDELAVQTLEAEVAATTARLDVFRKRLGA